MARLSLHLNKSLPQRFRGFRPRVLLLAGLLGLWALAVAWRTFDLQVLQHQALARLAKAQSQRVIKIKGKRGAIRDGKGRLLAASIRSRSFYAHPSLIAQPAQAAQRLAAALALPPDTLEAKLRSDAAFVWIKRQVTCHVFTQSCRCEKV